MLLPDYLHHIVRLNQVCRLSHIYKQFNENWT